MRIIDHEAMATFVTALAGRGMVDPSRLRPQLEDRLMDLWTADWPTEDLGVVPAIVYGDRSAPEKAHAAVLEADMPPAVFRDLAALVDAQAAVQALVGEQHFEMGVARTLRPAMAEALEVHQVEFIDHEVGWDCGCNEQGCLPGMPTVTEAQSHQVDMLYRAVLPYIVALNHHAASRMASARSGPATIVIRTEGEARAILDGAVAGFSAERERLEQDVADLTQQTVDLQARLREESERSTESHNIAQVTGRRYEQAMETLRLRTEALERVRLDRESAEADADRLRSGIRALLGEMGAAEGSGVPVTKVAERLDDLLAGVVRAPREAL